MVGQEKNIRTLIKWRLNKSVPRFLLISGVFGSGRLTLAKTIVNLLNAHGVIIENGISDIRQAIYDAYSISATTCYIFQNVDDMSLAAKNALLKVVEEPPNNAYFIMTCVNPENILDTIKSRGTLIKLEPYTQEELRQIWSESRIVHSDKNMLKYCTVPGQLNSDPEDFQAAEQCANGVLSALLGKSGTKLLKACTQLKAKESDENKVDCLLFFQIFKKCLFEEIQKNPDTGFKGFMLEHMTEAERQLNRGSSNKKAVIETTFIRILEDLKNEID